MYRKLKTCKMLYPAIKESCGNPQQVCKIVLECMIVMKILPQSHPPLTTSDNYFSQTTKHISEALMEI